MKKTLFAASALVLGLTAGAVSTPAFADASDVDFARAFSMTDKQQSADSAMKMEGKTMKPANEDAVAKPMKAERMAAPTHNATPDHLYRGA